MATEPIWRREGFPNRNQYRNAVARSRGFTSYRQERDASAKARGRPRDYQAERARANTLAQSRGFASASRERATKDAVKGWGITWAEFLRMNKANAAHWHEVNNAKNNTRDKFPYFIHRYRPPRNKPAKQYVKYIVSYYHAIVDEKHNWDSVRGSDGQWEMVERSMGNGETALVRKSDPWWYVYLVEAAELYSVDYYEGHYGMRGTMK